MLRWTAAALFDLQLIHHRIAENSEAAAQAVIQRIARSTEILIAFPRSGRVVAEYADEDLREIISGDYRVMYRVVGDDIYIAAVIHGNRDVVHYLLNRPGFRS